MVTYKEVQGFLVAGFLAGAITGSNAAHAQLILPNITVPNITVPAIAVPGVVTVPGVTVPGITIVLPTVNVPGVNLVDPLGLLPGLNLPLGSNVLLINLPGVSILLPNLLQLASLGNGAIGVVLTQVAPVNQLFSDAARANQMTPVTQLLDSLTSRGADSSSETPAPGTKPMPAGYAPLGVPSLWMWNAVAVGRTNHDGFRFQTGSADAEVSGATLPTRSIEKGTLPGVLWDASQVFGQRRGTFHLGLGGGVLESDVEIRSTEMLRNAGIAQAGSAKLTSWSLGAFALLTPGTWYTGAVVGGTWGQAETENYLLRTSGDYDTSGLLSAWIVGAVLPITSIIRVDVRGTLDYQRTAGGAHVDTLGISYSAQTIEAATGNVSTRLFGVFRQAGMTLRPFVQAGIAHRLHYENGLWVAGVDFTFDEADNRVFAATGIDVELNSFQLSAGIRREHSSDADGLSARFGLTLKLN